MTKKQEFVVWGLDDAMPQVMEEATDKRKKLYKGIVNRLDRIAILMLISTVVQVTLAYIILTKI